MSFFVYGDTQFKDTQCLLEALTDAGWTLEQIEVHAVPTNLCGYQGDTRLDVANIIIRRQNVGFASNDIGFVKKEDGSYAAIVSEYDRGTKYGEKWLNTLKQNYATRVTEREARRKGMTVKKTKKEDGTIKLVLQRAGK